MRPLKLDIDGFTAFRSPVHLDLTELDLFAVTGPTGAGKSSIIDAVCYALYGRVPRVGNEIKDCISQGLNRMLVTLEFLAAGERYRVFRETRRQGQPNVRVERCDGEDWVPLEQGATDVTKRIESLLGLSYDAFTRSVLLPQGQFQEFLAGSPSQRRSVLESLLRLDVYSRMRTGAAEIATEHKRDIDRIEKTLAEVFGEATPENLERQRDELDVRRAEAVVLAEKLAVWQRALKLAQALSACEEALGGAVAVRDRTAQAVTAARQLAQEGDTVLAKLADAVAELAAALRANSFDADLFAALTSGANLALASDASVKRYREAEARAKTRAAALEDARRASEAASQGLGAQTTAFDQAQHRLMVAHRGNQAASIQKSLTADDLCPVCGHLVESLPIIEAADLDEAMRAHDKARAAADDAQQAHTEAAAGLASAESMLQDARDAALQSRTDAQADRRKLEEALPGLEDRSSASLQTALRQQKAARDERLNLERSLKQAQEALAERQQAVSAARTDLAAKEQLLGAQEEAAAAAGRAREQAKEALTTLIAAAGLDALDQALSRGAGLAAACESELRTLAARNEAVQKDIGRLENLVDRLIDDIDKAGQLREEVARIKADYEVAADLAQVLMANRFGAFVQSEAMRVLAGQGSHKLQGLSGGRYRLDISENGQDFEVIDQWNAEDRRSVRTLSGGETFLASLALALALAETLPGLAPDRRVTLDAIFLDEGFGSLDPEALDRAAEALDSLRDGRRMVCVVTHLQELAQRMPARIVVEKSETGSRAFVA